MKHKWLVLFFTFLALFLRLFRLGLNDFKEDEYNSVNAATYLYSCQKDSTNCHFSNNPIDTNITNKLLVILTNNETKPNLFTEIYLWDWIKKAPTKTHYARAWPHLYNLTNIYSLFGISEFSSRLISVISGSLLIIVSFFFSFLFIGSVNLSLVYSLMITFSFYLIDISRNARMYSSFILIFQVLVYFTYRAIFESQTRQKNQYLLTKGV